MDRGVSRMVSCHTVDRVGKELGEVRKLDVEHSRRLGVPHEEEVSGAQKRLQLIFDSGTRLVAQLKKDPTSPSELKVAVSFITKNLPVTRQGLS